MSSLKENLKRSPKLVRFIRLIKWIISLVKEPLTGFFTLYYAFRLKKCGFPVYFSRTMIIRNPANIEIGSGCSFSNFVILDGHARITIGNNCMVANNVTIATATHDYTIEPMSQTLITKPVVLKDNVWLGIGVTVLPGITIEDGAVVGAMSLVTKDVPARAIVMGVPARVAKYRTE